MNPWIVIAKMVLAGALAFAVVAYVMWRTLKNSYDPGRLIFKWAITGVVIVTAGGVSLWVGWGPMLPPIGALFGLILGILWAPHIGALIAAPFTSLYDGGGGEPELKPLYSMSEARRKQGRYDDAILEVRRQLDRFPTDFQGWMLLAEIHAEDKHDAATAIATVDELLTHREHSQKNIAFALNRCADWELKFNQSSEGAMLCLQRIVDELPDTEFAQVALQRIAHLANPDSVAVSREAQPIALRSFDSRLGLRTPPAKDHAEGENGQELSDEAAGSNARDLLQRLESFPSDNDSRERLAILYAGHYKRLDLAKEQLEQLITAPNQPAKQVVHWLNLMTDLQMKADGDIEQARGILQRITELFPQSAYAENAMNRIAYLNLEKRGSKKSQMLKLGTYEKNLGLK